MTYSYQYQIGFTFVPCKKLKDSAVADQIRKTYFNGKSCRDGWWDYTSARCPKEELKNSHIAEKVNAMVGGAGNITIHHPHLYASGEGVTEPEDVPKIVIDKDGNKRAIHNHEVQTDGADWQVTIDGVVVPVYLSWSYLSSDVVSDHFLLTPRPTWHAS